MSTPEDPSTYRDIMRMYDRKWDNYEETGFNRELDLQDKENLSVWEHQEHYFDIGLSALQAIVNALANNRRPMPAELLDFPCGSGRVTRHLAAYFDTSRITASDLYDPHLEFCARTFGVDVLLSSDRIAQLDLGKKFDLIFCGSLLTHLPEARCKDVLDLFRRSLTDTGIAMVTFHGRYSDHLQKTSFKYVADPLYEVAQRDAARAGFGYVDYEHEFKSLFHRQENYGITLVRPSWVLRYLEACDDIRVLGYTERGWDNHQDVCVFGRPGINT